MQLSISHKTHYTFKTPPAYGLQQLRLTPKNGNGQSITEWSLSVEGGEKQASYSDENNNKVHLITLEPGSRGVTIISEGVLDSKDNGGIIGPHGGFAPLWYFLKTTPLTLPGLHVDNLMKGFGPDDTGDIGAFHALSAQILGLVAYETGETDAMTTAEGAMALGRGVCQDHAHIFIAASRKMGAPARYVSGYLMMNDRVDQDATHAWAEVWIDGIGWTGFDVSNGISPDARYVRVATGLDYGQAAPISGITFGGDGESVHVDVHVQQQ